MQTPPRPGNLTLEQILSPERFPLRSFQDRLMGHREHFNSLPVLDRSLGMIGRGSFEDSIFSLLVRVGFRIDEEGEFEADKLLGHTQEGQLLMLNVKTESMLGPAIHAGEPEHLYTSSYNAIERQIYYNSDDTDDTVRTIRSRRMLYTVKINCGLLSTIPSLEPTLNVNPYLTTETRYSSTLGKNHLFKYVWDCQETSVYKACDEIICRFKQTLKVDVYDAMPSLQFAYNVRWTRVSLLHKDPLKTLYLEQFPDMVVQAQPNENFQPLLDLMLAIVQDQEGMSDRLGIDLALRQVNHNALWLHDRMVPNDFDVDDEMGCEGLYRFQWGSDFLNCVTMHFSERPCFILADDCPRSLLAPRTTDFVLATEARPVRRTTATLPHVKITFFSQWMEPKWREVYRQGGLFRLNTLSTMSDSLNCAEGLTNLLVNLHRKGVYLYAEYVLRECPFSEDWYKLCQWLLDLETPSVPMKRTSAFQTVPSRKRLCV